MTYMNSMRMLVVCLLAFVLCLYVCALFACMLLVIALGTRVCV